MTDDELAKELHELKRRNRNPIALTEMFAALLSLEPGLGSNQRRRISYKIMARVLERPGRKDG